MKFQIFNVSLRFQNRGRVLLKSPCNNIKICHGVFQTVISTFTFYEETLNIWFYCKETYISEFRRRPTLFYILIIFFKNLFLAL